MPIAGQSSNLRQETAADREPLLRQRLPAPMARMLHYTLSQDYV
jgi:hypothetical protein